ncbi:DUF1772 domain-containing protein [Streptomyces iconiensis]|uniref:DUF1772 domain-containing protein n=1 Tax=Streptomyces iconiensis TaxID=1384038 RepID=A0ABT7A120_9ACTN|nr:anthrone oxygenase family protein [Streptomyces iconiensis]MDJ1135033.1 DUF1772 domain-containing protein [Streptomyces iconiensis]
MLGTWQGISLMAAVLATGLSAGLYYGFACAVMPGLRRAGDRTFVEAMQRINTAILNGWFLLLFLGSLLLTLISGGLHLAEGGGHGALPWIGAGAVLYAGVLGLTFRVNVPLNDALDAAGLPADEAALAAVRERFEDAWVRWNTVRAVVNTAAFACLAWALVRYGHAG